MPVSPAAIGVAMAGCDSPPATMRSRPATTLMHFFRREIELEQFYGDEPFAFGVVAAKDGSESSSTNLVKHAKRAERIGRRTAGLFRVQR
jgi:hypothetical protein